MRWIRSVRRACLDQPLIPNEQHLLRGYCHINFGGTCQVGKSARLGAQNGFNELANGAKSAAKWEVDHVHMY